MGGLGDILRNMVPSEGSGQGRAMAPGQAPQPGGGVGGLEDILKNMLPGGGAGQPASRGPAMAPGGGGLGDILGRIQEQMGRSSQVGPGGAPGGGLLDALGQILGQATQGVKEGAQRIDRATGASGQVRDALGRATGQSPEDLLRQLKELIENNRLAAGAAAGGLGGVLLGTRTGRSVLGSAAKLGGLALIAGLAYKAVQNYQQGRPLIGGDGGAQQTNLIEAPRGSGFETEAISNAAATAYIRGMIAAAAADGRIDASEQQSIIGGLKQMGLDAEAEEFLAAEINQPASVDDLVACVSSQEEAVQLFTAARVAIDLDTQEEHDFLVSLARGLGLDGQLVAHIDAAARGTA
jgi:uncharacterized membrane protein YebE (DUF533 family)